MRFLGFGSPKTSFRFQAVTSLGVLFAVTLTLSSPPASATEFLSPSEPIGRLEARILEIYRYGKHFSSCDVADNAKLIRLQIAHAVDERARDFIGLPPAGALPPSVRFDGIKLGTLKLKARPGVGRTVESPSSQTGWISTFRGWADLEKEYRTIRKQPTNARWVRLRARVISAITDDENRIFKGKWMQTSSQGVEQAPVLAKAVDDCLKEKKCDDLTHTENFPQALLLTRNVKPLFDASQKADATEKAKTTALTKLASEVRPYVNYFDPIPATGNVRFIENNTLVIPVDAGDLTGYETSLSSLVSKFWTENGFHVLVEWMTSTRELPLFAISLGDRFGVPSQVNVRARKIILSSDGYESTPAQAIGQALGFRPRLFSIWRSDRCQYEDQSNPSDLLSDARTGVVKASHWESLKKVYGRGKSVQ